MTRFPQFIDNDRKNLSDVLKDVAKNHDVLSIATGYWDIPGMFEVIKDIKGYKKVRLLIGKEPLPSRFQNKFKIDLDDPDNLFPDDDIRYDLEKNGNSEEIDNFRDTIKQMLLMIEENRLEVKVFRQPRLHAKAYIFGELGDGASVGIIGSSNFTRAGLTNNSELNFLTDDYKIVEFEPKTENQENGHLTWFYNLWNSDEAIDWTGNFTEIIQNSPLGDMTYGAYDVYIKTLMEIFPDELVNPEPFDDVIQEYLHPFQNQNALALRRKLYTNGVAMLSDSVGLGKTVTAAAIIDQYIKEGKGNIVLILPSSLKRQWIDELESEPWNLRYEIDFRIYTQQNIDRIYELIDKTKTRTGYQHDVNLFIIDEAHNLRNQNSQRYNAVLELLQTNPTSEVLLLTATPINNSILDFSYQIQLGAKGELTAHKVRYKANRTAKVQRVDFFKALELIQSAATRAEKNGEEFNWNNHKETLVSGLRHYVVRSTRQGVKKRQVIKKLPNQKGFFPNSNVEQFSYRYLENELEYINDILSNSLENIFEGINPQFLNLDLMGSITQRTDHPINIIKQIEQIQKDGTLSNGALYYNIDEAMLKDSILNESDSQISIITTIYKLINFLGFVPYRLDTYNNNLYNKSIETTRSNLMNHPKAHKIRIQFSMHNMLHVTWLKRLESSTASLLESVRNYRERLNLFESWLHKGYLVSLSDATILASEYSEDIDKAFEDYNEYLTDLDQSIQKGTEEDVRKRGVERKVADPKTYNIEQIQKDIIRDKNIINVIEKILSYLTSNNHDKKLLQFSNQLVNVLKEKKYGEKVLVFSFFSDTIEYLRKNLPEIISTQIPNFNKKSAFVSGSSTDIKKTAQLFSPNSQKYKLKKGEHEIDFLFATDVLSEGQNLQDAGILINYDLHWNPVRMIQRNGRINRLGSKFDNILIANARPHNDLETYLKLVARLENKIATINNTVGNDQSVLGETENPIEFLETIEESFGIYSTDTETATKAWEKAGNEESVMDWVDDYSLELRQFIDNNKETPEEIERVQNIPLGKWNYLPISQDFYAYSTEVFGLYRAYGYNSTTEERITDTAFVKFQPIENTEDNIFIKNSGISATFIPEDEALSLIRTIPENNKRILDTIDINRSKYITSGIDEVSVHMNSTNTNYKIKGVKEQALLQLQLYLPGYTGILELVSKNITKLNEKKEFERLIRQVNKEIKQNQQLRLSTINWAKRLFNELLKKQNTISEFDEIEGVVFYVYPK